MDIIFRKAKVIDLDGINTLIGDVFNHHLDEVNNNLDMFNLVGVHNNIVVAHLYVTKIYNAITKENWYKIDDLCVMEDYRGLGIGTKLLEELDQMAKSDNISYLELTSNKKRCAAHKLYQKNNFKIIETDLFRKEIN